MGERKGVNKYYPPDYDPSRGGLNKWQGTHALRERARKLHLGILVIRFEMPYNIWCGGCGNHIGMGVRYNAEKSKVGMYYSTPIYKFRMKCHLCDNHFEMQTDPANLDYIVLNGARRQEKRFDPAENGTVVPEERSQIRRLASDGMFQLQHQFDDKQKLDSSVPTLARLECRQRRLRDDFDANDRVRRTFRMERRKMAKRAHDDSTLRAKSGLDLPLLEESDRDRQMASLMRLHDPIGSEQRQQERRSAILSSSVLHSTSTLHNAGFSLTATTATVNKPISSLSIGVRRPVRKSDHGFEPGSVNGVTSVDSEEVHISKTRKCLDDCEAAVDEKNAPHIPESPTTTATNSLIGESGCSDVERAQDESVCRLVVDYSSSDSN